MGIKNVSVVSFLCLLATAALSAQTSTTLDFDSVNAGHGRLVAAGYFAKYGIALSDVTPGTLVVIDNAKNFYGGRALAARSAPNVLTQINSNDPVSFTLTLPAPARAVRFTRPALIAGPTGITFPQWKVEAFDKTGRLLSRAGEPLGSGASYYSDVPARIFDLTGPGIKTLKFGSNNMHFAAFSALVIDDLVLVGD